MTGTMNRSVARALSALLVAFGMTLAGPALAQERAHEPLYVTVDMGVAGAVADPVEDQFEIGGAGAVGMYYALIPELALGGEVLGGALAEGHRVPQDPVDRGVADFGLMSASLRIYPFASLMAAHTDHRSAGFYLQASPGVALFDGEVVPGYAAAAGYDIPLGPITIGPKFRFMHFIETHGRFGDSDPLVITGAVEVAFLDAREPVAEPEPFDAANAPPAELDLVPVAMSAEPLPSIEMGPNPALRVDQRAYFDFDEVTLRPEAEQELDLVAMHYGKFGDRYERLIVEGHADDRGHHGYDEPLSAARALAVVRYLVGAGVPLEAMEVRAFGESDPLTTAQDTPLAHQINRRVQVEVVWNDALRPPGEMPEPDPTLPARIDPADDEDDRPGRAERLLEEQRRALAEVIGQDVHIAIRDVGEARGLRRVEIQTASDSVARR